MVDNNLRYNGGPRLATVMIWLSSVEEGGRTVFDGAGVAEAARPGAALVWWNLRSDGSLDSRNHHMGCPVIRGNKWIANKVGGAWGKLIAEKCYIFCYSGSNGRIKCGHIPAQSKEGDI